MGITSTHWLYYWVEQGTRIPAVLIHFVMPLSLKETKWVPAGESKETWKAPLDEWECHNCPPPIFGDYKTLLNHGPLDIDWERAKQKPTIAAWIREQRFYQWATHAAQLSSPFAVFFFFLLFYTTYFCLSHYTRKLHNYPSFANCKQPVAVPVALRFIFQTTARNSNVIEVSRLFLLWFYIYIYILLLWVVMKIAPDFWLNYSKTGFEQTVNRTNKAIC